MSKIISVGLYGNRANHDELGHFASEIFETLDYNKNFSVTKLDSTKAEHLDVVVYAARSPKKLQDATRLCAKLDIPLILLSSDMQKELDLLKPACRVQVVPNSSVEIQDYHKLVVEFYKKHPDWQATLTEYHQKSKTDTSGTALAIAKDIKVSPEKILSIRDDKLAKLHFEIPEQNLNSYAIHQVTFNNSSTDLSQTFEIKVFGRRTYTEGLIQLINWV